MIVNTTCTITHTTTADANAWYSVPFTYVTVLNVPQIDVTLNGFDLTYNTDYVVGTSGLKLLTGQGAGQTLVITRHTPRTQTTDFQTGMIDPDEIESSLDLAVMRDQEIDTAIERAAAMPLDHEARLNVIESKIPAEATSSNKLADKAYVTSSINTKAATLQPKITSSAKLSADLVDDTSTTHKFVSTSEKSTWNGKQNALNTAQMNAVNSGVTSTTVSQVATNTTDIANRVVKNVAITGATKCKITYDSKGLVTGGASISTADLTNVNISSPSNGQVLMYNSTSQKWENKTSTTTVAFDGITGQPRSNTALANEFDKYVSLTGNQTIAGSKTFSGNIKFQNGSTTTYNGFMYKTSNGNMSLGIMNSDNSSWLSNITFSTAGGIGISPSSGQVVSVPTPSAGSNSIAAATTAWVKTYALGVPDWSSQTGISTPWTATKNGYIYAYQYGGDAHLRVFINQTSTTIGNAGYHYVGGFYGPQSGTTASGLIPVRIGDVVSLEFTNTAYLYFVPCKNL